MLIPVSLTLCCTAAMAPALTATSSQTILQLPGSPPPIVSENRLQEERSAKGSHYTVLDKFGVSSDLKVWEQLSSQLQKQHYHSVLRTRVSKTKAKTYNRKLVSKSGQQIELSQNSSEGKPHHKNSSLSVRQKSNQKTVDGKMNKPSNWNSNVVEKQQVSRSFSKDEKMQNGYLDHCQHDNLFIYEKPHVQSNLTTRTEKPHICKSMIMCQKSDIVRQDDNSSSVMKNLQLNNDLLSSKLRRNNICNNKITVVHPITNKECTCDNSLSVVDRLNAAGRKLYLLERRSQLLLHRLRRLQGHKLDVHVKGQLKAFVDFQHQNLQSVASKAIEPFNDLPNTFFNCDDVKNLSTSNLVTLVRKLQASQPKFTMENNKKSERNKGILVMDNIVSAESERKSGHLRTYLQHWISTVDSDATESSSGGESCEEWEDCPVMADKKVPTPLYKRAEWKWSVQRAAIVARWTWLQAQISDLEYRIRQQSEIHRTIRNSKGVVALSDTPIMGPAGDAGSIFKHCSDMSSAMSVATLMINVNKQASKLSQSLGNCLSPLTVANDKIGNSSTILNGVVDCTTSTQQNCPNTPVSGNGLVDTCDLKTPLDSSCVAARCRPVKSYRKRKLLQTAGLYQVNSKAARLSSVKCQCYPPIMPCSLCGGRYNNVQRLDAEGMPVMEKVSLLDPAFHPVLSFPQEIALSIHFEALLKSGEWEMSKAAAKSSLRTIATEKRRQKLSAQLSARKYRKTSAASVLLTSAKLRVKYEGTSPNKGTKRLSTETHLRRKELKRRRVQQLAVALQKSVSHDTDGESMSALSQNDTPSPQMKDGVLSLSASSASLKDQKDCRKKRFENAYDINNIVIPYSMAASTRVEKIQYKEIQTPKWREVGQEENGQDDGNMENEEVEDLTDEAYENRHEICESDERRRFRSFVKCPPVRRSRLSRESESNTHDAFSPDCSLNDTQFDNGMTVTLGHEDGRRHSVSTSRRSSLFDDYIWEQTHYYYEVEKQEPWSLRQFPLSEEFYEEMKNEVVIPAPIRMYRRRRTVRMPDDPSMEFVSPECDITETPFVPLSPALSNGSGMSMEDDDPEWNATLYERRSSTSSKHTKR